MKRTKKLLSFFLAIVMVITAFAAVPFTSNAADFNGNLTTTDSTGYRYYAGHNATSNRINSSGVSGAVTPTINICNDGGSSNFCAGLWVFDMNANIPNRIGTITATLTIKVIGVNGDSKGINFYITGDTPDSVNNSSLTGNSSSVETVKGYFNSTGLTLVRSVSQNVVNQTATYTIDVSSYVKTAKESGWNRFNVFAIQETAGDANSNSSAWSDLHIEKPTIYVDAKEPTGTIDDLKSAINAFENKMNDGKTYKNVSAAYSAYVEANKAYDSYYYGLKTDISVSSYVNNLYNAIDNMTEQSITVNQHTPGGVQGDSTSYSYTVGNTHQNVLYSPKVTYQENTDYFFLRKVNSSASEDSNDINDVRLGYPTTVLFYDGVNTPKFPIFLYFKRTNNGTIRIYQLYPAIETAATGLSSSIPAKSNFFVFNQNWKTQVSSSDYSTDYLTPWNTGTTGIEVNASSDPSTYTLTGYSTSWGNWIPKWGRGANVLSYTGTPNSAMDVYTIKWFRHGGINTNSDMSDSNFGKKVSLAPMPIYVLNIKGIQSLLNSKRESVKDISKFKEDTNGDVSAMLTSYDNLVMNYDGLDYSNAASIRENLNTQYTNLNGRAATADNVDGYPAVRAAIDTPKQIPALVDIGDTTTYSVYDILSNDNADGKFTTSSYATFKNSYNTAKNFMANVITDGYSQVDFADVAAKALNNAINALQVVADFTTITANYTEASNILNTYDSSLYTTSTWNALVNAINNATFATYDDTQKKDTGRTSYQATIDSQAEALRTAIDNLARRADFTNYNKAFDVATNSTTGYLIPYTTNSVSTLPTYNALQKYNGITIYNNQDDTPETVQNEINTAANNLVNANTSVYSDTVDQSGLIAFSTSLASYDKDVFDTATVDAIKTSANNVYKVVKFNGTDYYSLDVTDQSDLDAKIREYINSFNSSLDKYSVAVSSNVTVKVNGITQSPNAETGKYEFVYGTKVEFSAPTADTAWYMNYDSETASRTQQFQKYAQTYTATIIGNMTIDARTKSDATPYRVTVERDYGVEGMTNGMAYVDFTAGGDYTLTAMPNHPYFSFDGYYIGGTKLDSNTVNITGNTTIIAKYVKNGEDLTVNVNGTSSTYAYNSKVTISESGAYAWVEKVNGSADTWRPFYIGSGCTFRVTESIELKPVTEAEFNTMFAGKEAFAPNTRQSGAIADASTNKATINAQRVDYLPQGAQITEYGILVAKDARTDDFNLENMNDDSIRAKSTKLISGNQFSIGLTNLANTNFTYRSYMIYQVPATTDETGKVTSWETKTVYSEIMTYSGATV